MATLTITRGLPASGKTSWAKEVQRDKPDTVLVCKDDLRAMLFDSQWTREREHLVVSVEEEIVRNALAAGKDVIVHNTHGAPEHVERFRQLAAYRGAEFVVKDFIISVPESVKRDVLRGDKSVGLKAIERMAGYFPAELLGKSSWQPPYDNIKLALDRWRSDMSFWPGRGRLWFISDIHVNHTNCARWRGFWQLDADGNIVYEPAPAPGDCNSEDHIIVRDGKRLRPIGDHETMNGVIRLAVMAAVKPQDFVIVLGDVAMGQRADSLKWYDNLPGTWAMIPGNHDHNGPWNARQEQLWSLYKEHFDYVFPPICDMTLKNGMPVTLCHFPYGELDHTEKARFTQYRPPDNGGWLLHGHTHSKDKHQGERMVHIGVDAWQFGPVSEGDVIAEILG